MRNVNNNNDNNVDLSAEVEACWDERDADLCICSDPTDGHEARCPQA